MTPQKILVSLLSLAIVGCEETFVPQIDETADVLTRAGQAEDRMFYYYGIENRKVYLDQVKDQMYIKFAPTTTKEQFSSIVNANASLRSTKSNLENAFVDGISFNKGTVLEGNVSSDAFKSLKAKKEIVSTTHLLKSGNSLFAYTTVH